MGKDAQSIGENEMTIPEAYNLLKNDAAFIYSVDNDSISNMKLVLRAYGLKHTFDNAITMIEYASESEVNKENLELLWELLMEGEMLALTDRQYDGLKYYDLSQISLTFDGQYFKAQKIN